MSTRLPDVHVFPANDLDLGGILRVRASGAVAPGKTVTAWLSETRVHTTNTPAADLHADTRKLLVETEVGVSGQYEGALDRQVIDDQVIDVSPKFFKQGPRKLYVHWDDGDDFHAYALCVVEAA